MKMLTAMVSKAGGREINTDEVACHNNGDSLGCWLVVDGQSEQSRGQIAAQNAIQTMLHIFTENPAISVKILSSVFEWTHRELLELQAADKSLHASAAMFCTGGRSALWGHMGNARVYAFREGAVVAQTKDHSSAQGLVNAGEIHAGEIRGHHERHRLVRALGLPGMPQPTILEERFILKPGDLFLLCTDGFWEHVTEVEMLIDWCKSATVQQWLEHMEERLLRVIPDDHDCYSAIALLAEV